MRIALRLLSWFFSWGCHARLCPALLCSPFAAVWPGGCRHLPIILRWFSPLCGDSYRRGFRGVLPWLIQVGGQSELVVACGGMLAATNTRGVLSGAWARLWASWHMHGWVGRHTPLSLFWSLGKTIASYREQLLLLRTGMVKKTIILRSYNKTTPHGVISAWDRDAPACVCTCPWNCSMEPTITSVSPASCSRI